MPNYVSIPVKNAMEAMSYVEELKSMGLKAGVDFTWRYNGSRGDYFTNDDIIPASVDFTFINESLLSYAELKWG